MEDSCSVSPESGFDVQVDCLGRQMLPSRLQLGETTAAFSSDRLAKQPGALILSSAKSVPSVRNKGRGRYSLRSRQVELLTMITLPALVSNNLGEA